MAIRKRVLTTAILSVFAFSLLVTGGCTKYASQDDLQNLEEAKQAAISAEKEVEKVKAQRKKLEKDLAAKEDELKKAEEELETVKNR